MSTINSGLPIVRSGLVVALDATSNRSYSSNRIQNSNSPFVLNIQSFEIKMHSLKLYQLLNFFRKQRAVFSVLAAFISTYIHFDQCQSG